MTGRVMPGACVLILFALSCMAGAAEPSYAIKLHRPDKVGDELEIAAARAMRTTTRYEVGEREPQVSQRMIAADIRGRVTVLAVDERGTAQKASWVVEHATIITSPRKEERPLLPKGAKLIAEAGKERTTFTATDADEKNIELNPEQQYALRLVASLSSSGDVTSDVLFGTRQKQAVGGKWPVNAEAMSRDAARRDLLFEPEAVEGSLTLKEIRRVDDLEFLEIGAQIKINDARRSKPEAAGLPEGLEAPLSTRESQLSFRIPVDPNLPHLDFSRTDTWVETAEGSTGRRPQAARWEQIWDSTFEMRVRPAGD